MEVDQAVFFAVSARGWQFLAGPVTMLLIAVYFTPELQGYYYTFWSLLALQLFFDLAFGVVVLNVASHEWAKLRLDERGAIAGDPASLSRLVSLGRLIFRWYAAASGLFMVGVGAGGILFFRQQPDQAVDWTQPWLWLVVVSGLLLWSSPFLAILEGCNQMATVNRFRVVQAVTGNLVVWVCIPLGANLWTTVAAAGVRLFWELFLVCVRYRRFFRPFWSRPAGPLMDWRGEIWPMQWRLAVHGVVGYFSGFLFTPVMCHYHGLAVAGQMGMTWQVLTALQAAALAWVQTRSPRFGMLIAQREFGELDRIFTRLSAISVAVLAAGGTAFWCVDYLLHVFVPRLAERLLPPLPTALFVVAVVLYQLPQCQTFYIRAHKRDPLLLVSIVSSTAIGLLVWLLGSSRLGPLGAAGGYLAVVAVFTVPSWTIIWSRCRSAWH